MAKFCAGLPLAEVRGLRFEEMSDVRSDLRTIRTILAAFAGLGPFALLGWVLGFILFGRPYFFLVLICGLVACGAVWAGVWLCRCRYRQLSRDIESRRALIYRGSVSKRGPDDLQARLYIRGLLKHDDEGLDQEIEVFAGSKRISRINGALVQGWISADLGFDEVADDVPNVAQAPETVLPSRELNSVESMELAASGRGWQIATLASATLSIILFAAAIIAAKALWPWPGLELFLVIITASVLATLATICLYIHSSVLGGDVRSGEVLVHEIPVGADPERVGNSRPLHQIRVESLLHSGRTWAVEGHPAGWRGQNRVRRGTQVN